MTCEQGGDWGAPAGEQNRLSPPGEGQGTLGGRVGRHALTRCLCSGLELVQAAGPEPRERCRAEGRGGQGRRPVGSGLGTWGNALETSPAGGEQWGCCRLPPQGWGPWDRAQARPFSTTEPHAPSWPPAEPCQGPSHYCCREKETAATAGGPLSWGSPAAPQEGRGSQRAGLAQCSGPKLGTRLEGDSTSPPCQRAPPMEMQCLA